MCVCACVGRPVRSDLIERSTGSRRSSFQWVYGVSLTSSSLRLERFILFYEAAPVIGTSEVFTAVEVKNFRHGAVILFWLLTAFLLGWVIFGIYLVYNYPCPVRRTACSIAPRTLMLHNLLHRWMHCWLAGATLSQPYHLIRLRVQSSSHDSGEGGICIYIWANV